MEWVINHKSFIGDRVLPAQMFLRNKKSGKQDKDVVNLLTAMGDVVRENQISYFTHAAYTINLCKNINWARAFLYEDLKQTSIMNGRGVVVHTGSACGNNKEDALDLMETMVRKALRHATQTCKLLLETPCGEGEEVCTTVEEMCDFMLRFDQEERSKLGLCVDTAHIHASGYNPIDYLVQWYEINPVNIELVHFNDSKVCCGSCVDRHEYPGSGHIGYDKMTFTFGESCEA
jgi:deoxyribonuclease-4